MGFQISQGPVQKSLDVCVHTAKWAFSSRHWQFINWDPRHFLLEYFADTVSTHLFLFPNHLSLPIRKREILDSQKEKMCCFPQSGFLFQISSRWIPQKQELGMVATNFRSPQGPLTRKAICIEQREGRRKPLDVFTTKCCPHPIVLARPLGPLLWIQGPPPQKMHNMGFFFLSSFVFIQAMGPPSTQNTPTKRHVLFFCPTHKKKGYQPFREKRNKEGKKRMIIQDVKRKNEIVVIPH